MTAEAMRSVTGDPRRLAEHGVAEPTVRKPRRNPAPFILGAAALLLALYYVAVSMSGVFNQGSIRTIENSAVVGEDYLTLRMQIQDIDLSNKAVSASVLPIPYGKYAGPRSGEMSQGLRIEVSSGGVTSTVVTYPGESIIDPTGVKLALDRGSSAYPFDRPFANYQLSVTNDKTGEAVPFKVDLENSARPWVLTATAAEPVMQGNTEVHPITLDGARDKLNILVVGFYVIAIILTTLMAVVTIGSAILNRTLQFANVIWLSATMLSFPALRSAMPGAPPMGTALDFLVVFPGMALVAAMLIWTGSHMLWKESSVLRRRTLEDPKDGQSEVLEAAE